MNIRICVTCPCVSATYLIRGSPYCDRLAVGCGDISDLTMCQTHLQIPSDNPEEPEVIKG